jgi:hypothetical protein
VGRLIAIEADHPNAALRQGIGRGAAHGAQSDYDDVAGPHGTATVEHATSTVSSVRNMTLCLIG